MGTEPRPSPANQSRQCERGSRPKIAVLGIFAWNEEKAIAPMLRSLFRQSLFEELERRGAACEIVCVLNGCTDNTAAVAREFFEVEAQWHPCHEAFSCRVVELPERGKTRAWNQFVHRVAPPDAPFLFMMDADIVIHLEHTLRNMLLALERDPKAHVSTDRPCKDLEFRSRSPVRRRLSLTASNLTQSAPAQLCAQLYCIRADIARNIYLPRDLAACEDGFIKGVVCTDFSSHPVDPSRIRVATGAGHVFEAYTSPFAIFRNQKRQIIGQTILHLLLDCFLPTLSASRRRHLAETLRDLDRADPAWLKRLIAEHLRQTRYCWRLYPGLLGQRLRRLAHLRPGRRWRAWPVAAAFLPLELAASFVARRALKNGALDYWPRAIRAGLDSPAVAAATSAGQPY